MSGINLNVQASLPKLKAGQLFAKLCKVDGSEPMEFLVNPGSIRESLESNYAKMAVLQTGQPLVRYQSSSSTITLQDVRFYSTSNMHDLNPILERLRSWVIASASSRVPALLKFQWGSYVLPRVYLESMELEITQRREGKPTEAKGSMLLLLSPEDPKAIKVDVSKDETGTKLSDREQADNTTKVKAAIAKDKQLAQKLKVGAQDEIKVAKNGDVTTVDPKTKKERKLGTVKELLGAKAAPGISP